jgi:hypothetical protein
MVVDELGSLKIGETVAFNLSSEKCFAFCADGGQRLVGVA